MNRCRLGDNSNGASSMLVTNYSQSDPGTLSDYSPETDENRTYLIKIYLREMLLESFLFLSFFKLIP